LVILPRPFWDRGLQYQIQLVLDREYPDKYRVGEPVLLNTGFFSSQAVYELFSSEAIAARVLLPQSGPIKQYGIIARISTQFGPLPGVFITHSDGTVHFVGFGLNFERFQEQFGQSLLYPRMNRVERRVAETLSALPPQGDAR
jgi:hypothetical protein